MVPFFPKPVAFASVLGTFPEGAAYAGQLRSMIAERAGPVYLVLEAETNYRLNAVEKMNARFSGIGLTKSHVGCQALSWIFKKLLVRAAVQETAGPGENCEIILLARDDKDISVENRALAMQKSKIMALYGFHVDIGGCAEYDAYIGDNRMPYQFCPVLNAFSGG
jgi:hypothetical protein